ncbi:DUF6766 family protein [Devosia sp. CN2-171]|uniref:DUF6766 family protein n=1 Tax=Devosia sp. CN2-171 TaxID=3400909 RepID=UPI003BF78524
MSFFRNNGLTVVLLVLTALSLVGMGLAGLQLENATLAEHGSPATDLWSYIASGSFISAVFENWESEFLQMSFYVVLTAFLFQRGSSESKDPEAEEEVDEDPAKKKRNKNAPWPVRAGGLWLWLYSYSLGIVLVTLFLVSFIFHWMGSTAASNDEAALHGQPPASWLEHLGSAQLWFESFQNWQSEFLSTAVIVVLSIFLRFRFSPESKPVAASHRQTGN